MSGQNLDRLCAQYGYRICQAVAAEFKDKDGKPDKAKTENHITKSLAVLQEDGVYAFFIYLFSRGERERAGAARLREKAHGLLAEQFDIFKSQSDSLLAARHPGVMPLV
ncbi:MAG TPA: hypothetical protein EYP19_09145 [Desulfobacterales bacterium]|nr:hypothetical protein [Desulfobacterales bacterium]